MFFFQSMFQTVYAGITGSNALLSVQTIAEGILLLCTLFGVYEAYSRGGDTRGLAVVGAKYLVMGLIVTQYPNVFLNVNNAFNSLAQTISPDDVVTNFRGQVSNYMSSDAGSAAWWSAIPGGLAGALSLLFQAIAVLIFPITYVIFAFFYSMYGAVLYICGPLVLALYPSFGVGQLAKTYIVNLLTWNAWGIIYAIMSQLLTLMSAGSLTNILSAQNFGGAFQGASQMLLISLSSILISLMIALIPFIAKRIVSGDVGSTMFAVIGAAGAAVQTAVVASAGMGAGMARTGDDPGGGGGGGGGASINSNSNRPPKPPEDRGPGDDGDHGPGGQDASSGRPPRGPGDDGGGGVRVLEASGTQAAGGFGSPPPNRERGSAQSYPRPHVSGLQWITYGIGWTAGTTVRIAGNTFSSSDQKET